MPETPVSEFEALLNELVRREVTNGLASYQPYRFQKDWHNALGHDSAKPAQQKALMAGNQVGKTVCGAAEDAIHLTGLYPDWWTGRRFTSATNIMIAGVTADKTRDTLQTKLFGDPHNEDAFGTGMVPRDCILGKPVRKQGYVDAYDSVAVRHYSGGISRARFQAYEQGERKFMATGFHVVHFDEEPPPKIYSQGLRSVIATKGIINLTFTPEEGITDVVDGFMNEIKAGQALVMAEWDDAEHIAADPEHRAQLLAALSPHEREMREKGIPQMGSGVVYAVKDDLLSEKVFEIPVFWPRICGVDMGGADHPFAAVWLALDRDHDTVHVYDAYKAQGPLPVHADALKRRGCNWIPTAWPTDLSAQDKMSGRQLADILREDFDLAMLPEAFSNPPAPGQADGQGGRGVEAGIWAMLTAMQEGRFKVAEHLSEWFREKGIYHRKDGKLIKRFDDLMDATRYGYQSLRYADLRPKPQLVQAKVRRGASNW